MKRNRKAKILATLGPASSDKKIIEDLFVAGCDVFRLNFSHGDLETHRKNYENIRSLEEKHNHASCILADLQGPKLRVGTFKNTKENLVKGQSFVLDLSSEPGDNNRVNFPHEEIYDFLTPNSILLVNDGRIRLQVVEQKKDSLITEVLNDAEISNNKGVNIPDVILPIDALTKKDKSQFLIDRNQKPYFIYVGSLHKRKNIERMLKAFQLYNNENQMEFIIVGKDMWKGQLNLNGLLKNVRFLGRKSGNELAQWVGASSAPIYISYFEGFGLPVLEGMMAGVPVVSGNTTSLPEVGGSSVIYVDPFNIASIKQGMKEAISNQLKYKDLGIKQAQKFSWDQSAKTLYSVIKKYN